MPQSLFTSQTPVVTNASDGAPGITTATSVQFTEAGEITHVRFYATTTVSGTYTGAVWRVTADDSAPASTLLASKVLAGSPTPGWNTIALDTPVPVTPGNLYRIGLHNSAGRYVATNSFFVVPLVNGSIIAESNGNDPVGLGSMAQGTFAINAALTYPFTGGSASSYFADVVFVADSEDAGDRALSGTLTVPALTLTGALTRTTPPVVSGTLTLPHLTLTGALTNSDPVSTEHAHGFPLRAELAEALDAVAGVRGYPRKPSAAKAGDSWPRIGTLTHIAPGSWETEWQVVILLPTDDGRQDEWIITRLDDITDALAPLVWVVNVEVGASADAPALLINCRE